MSIDHRNRRTTVATPQSITMGNSPLEEVEAYKFLGLYLDNKLKFINGVNGLVMVCERKARSTVSQSC